MGLAIPSAPSAVATADAAIRVMVVDDSVVVRGLVSRWIEEEPGLALAYVRVEVPDDAELAVAGISARLH